MIADFPQGLYPLHKNLQTNPENKYDLTQTDNVPPFLLSLQKASRLSNYCIKESISNCHLQQYNKTAANIY